MTKYSAAFSPSIVHVHRPEGTIPGKLGDNTVPQSELYFSDLAISICLIGQLSMKKKTCFMSVRMSSASDMTVRELIVIFYCYFRLRVKVNGPKMRRWRYKTEHLSDTARLRFEPRAIGAIMAKCAINSATEMPQLADKMTTSSLSFICGLTKALLL